jgi:hypothetical protein
MFVYSDMRLLRVLLILLLFPALLAGVAGWFAALGFAPDEFRRHVLQFFAHPSETR